MNLLRFLLVSYLLFNGIELFSQCPGFPATVADGNCISGAPLTSGANINSGDNLGYCGNVTTTPTFNNLNLNGGTIRICGNVNLQGNWNSGIIVVSCGSTVNFPSGLLLNNDVKVINYGRVTVNGNLEFQNMNNCFYNETSTSSLTVSGDIIYGQNTNQTAYLKNAGYIRVNGTFNAREGGFTCFTNTGRMETTNLTYIQNCGGPANRFTFGSTTGSAIIRYSGTATIRANFTASSSLHIYRATGAITNSNCSASFGSANLFDNTLVLVPPVTPQICSTANCFTVLPVELLTFKGKYVDRTAQLCWTTSAELNNDYFTIEKSSDGINWSFAATVEGAGNSNNTLHYTWIDESPLQGTNYYRLSQTDYDGTTVQKSIVIITIDGDDEWKFTIYPNPSSDFVNLTLPENEGHELTVEVIDLTGRKVLVKNIGSENVKYMLNISELQTGVYTICLYDEGTMVGSSKLLKN